MQACTWPLALQGRDVIGIAETGRWVPPKRTFGVVSCLLTRIFHSGKTLAFGIPALSRLATSLSSDNKMPKTPTITILVIAPTRELAIQTHETLSALGAAFGVSSVAIFGGVPKEPQIVTLSNATKGQKSTRIVVGTPGRVLDLVNDGACDLSQSDVFVICLLLFVLKQFLSG